MIQALADTAPVAEEYFPTPQSMHVLFEFAPTAGEYLPTPQFTHVLLAELPVTVEYFPATQSTQLLDAEAPVLARYLPVSQSVHVVLPFTVLYFPAAQGEHISPSGPVNPALQIQLLRVDDPLRDSVPTGHSKQYMLLLAPSVNEYVLMAQLVQALSVDAPVSTRNFPAGQLKQFEAPDCVEYLPPTQSTQVLVPLVSAYLPAIQLLQIEAAAAEKVPEVQSVQTVVSVSVHHVPVKPEY